MRIGWRIASSTASMRVSLSRRGNRQYISQSRVGVRKTRPRVYVRTTRALVPKHAFVLSCFSCLLLVVVQVQKKIDKLTALDRLLYDAGKAAFEKVWPREPRALA